MMERLIAAAAQAARRRARARIARLAGRLRPMLPPGVEVREEPEGVRLAARGLRRRRVIEPGLRWLLARLR
jgi:hypothetical protein